MLITMCKYEAMVNKNKRIYYFFIYRITRKSYPKIDAVFKPRKMCITPGEASIILPLCYFKCFKLNWAIRTDLKVFCQFWSCNNRRRKKNNVKRKKRFVDEFQSLNLSSFESQETLDGDDFEEGIKNRVQEIEDLFKSIYMDHDR